MFIGHFGAAMMAKKWAPAASLGTLLLAQQMADALWPIFFLTGIEQARVVPGIMAANHLDLIRMPWSHSLLMLIVWGAAFAAIHYAARRDARTALALGGLVVSHWLLDVIAHRPDMQLAPGIEQRFGLRLWDSLPATIAVETGMFLAGIYIYMRGTRAKNWRGTVPLWLLFFILLAGFFASLFGPPPPDLKAVAYASLAGWLFLLLAVWADRNRTSIASA